MIVLLKLYFNDKNFTNNDNMFINLNKYELIGIHDIYNIKYKIYVVYSNVNKENRINDPFLEKYFQNFYSIDKCFYDVYIFDNAECIEKLLLN